MSEHTHVWERDGSGRYCYCAVEGCREELGLMDAVAQLAAARKENQRLREALEGLIEVIEEEDIDVGFSNIYTKKLIANAALGRSDTEAPND